METTDVRNLVTHALRSLPRPYSEHAIDEVFFAIESNPRWLKEYEGLCLKHTKTVVNTLGGYWIGRTLGKIGRKQVPSKKSALIGSYSVLDTDAKPRAIKPRESDALELMSRYYRDNRATLPPVTEMKKYRDSILELLMDGVRPEVAFELVLRGDA
jgi:hypothetical protein